MAVSVKIDSKNREATLVPKKRFTFCEQEAFTEAYLTLDRTFDHYCVDLREVAYMDRAAMAMLIQFKEHVGADRRKPVTVFVSRGQQVEQALLNANLESIFRLAAA